MYIDCILYLKQNKCNVPFSTLSPILLEISLIEDWQKVKDFIFKMFKTEILC